MSAWWWLVAIVVGFAVEAFIIGPSGFGGDAAALAGRLLLGGLLFGVIIGALLRIVIGLTRGLRGKLSEARR